MKSTETIETEITFLKGVRVQLPSGAGYAPHFVVTGDEEWLGVRFRDFPVDGKFDVPYRVVVELIYADRINYGKLKEGSTFVVHEGAKVVAKGRVLSPK